MCYTYFLNDLVSLTRCAIERITHSRLNIVPDFFYFVYCLWTEKIRRNKYETKNDNEIRCHDPEIVIFARKLAKRMPVFEQI